MCAPLPVCQALFPRMCFSTLLTYAPLSLLGVLTWPPVILHPSPSARPYPGGSDTHAHIHPCTHAHPHIGQHTSTFHCQRRSTIPDGHTPRLQSHQDQATVSVSVSGSPQPQTAHPNPPNPQTQPHLHLQPKPLPNNYPLAIVPVPAFNLSPPRPPGLAIAHSPRLINRLTGPAALAFWVAGRSILIWLD